MKKILRRIKAELSTAKRRLIKCSSVLIGLGLILSSCYTDPHSELEISYTDYSERSALREAPTTETVTIVTSSDSEYSKGTLVNSATRILVPLDEYFTVKYESILAPYPEWYERGTSEPVIVTDPSTNTITVSILVVFNTDHPITLVTPEDNETETCKDNCTVDNETTEVTTTVARWSDNFTRNSRATTQQVASYDAFCDNITVDQGWDNISIGNPDNYTTCTEPNNIINLYKQKNSNAFYMCDGKKWNVGICGAGMSIAVGTSGDCSCGNSAWTVRPGIGNSNWGGVGNECRAHSQTLTVFFER